MPGQVFPLHKCLLSRDYSQICLSPPTLAPMTAWEGGGEVGMFPPLLGPASPDPALTLADIDKPTSLLLAPDQSELTGMGRTIAHL